MVSRGGLRVGLPVQMMGMVPRSTGTAKALSICSNTGGYCGGGRARWFCALGLGLLVAALLVTMPQTPVYQAKTSLELLNLNEDFMNMKDVEQVADQNGYDLLTDIQTQIRILQSDTLLDRVLGELRSAGTGTRWLHRGNIFLAAADC